MSRTQSTSKLSTAGGTLECRDLARAFGGVRAVDGVSATFGRGQITALVGPNGAGKTTLFHLLAGSLRPDSGEVLYNGTRIDRRSSFERARLGIGRLFQDVRVFRMMTVEENVLLACPIVGEDPVTPLLRRGRVRRDEDAYRKRVPQYLELSQLDTMRDMRADALSFGQQKLLALTRLLASGASTLLLDEPTAGVDPGMITRVSAFVRGLARQQATVVLIEHNMNVIRELADWVYFLDEGRVVAVGTPDQVLGDPTVRATYLGL